MSNKKRNESVMHELYRVRTEEFRYNVAKENCAILNKAEKVVEDIEEYLNEQIKDEKIINKITNILDDFQSEVSKVQTYWDEVYYKEGLVDAMRMQKYLFEELVIDIFELDIINNSKQISDVDYDKLVNFVIHKIKDENVKNTILLKLDILVQATNEEREFWRKKFYDKGYYDMLKLKREIKQYRS